MKNPSKAFVATAVALVMASLIVACGQVETSHDPATEYSADSLGRELIFRFRSLTATGKAPGTGKISPKGKESADRAAAKSKEATKQSQVLTLDGLVADVADKAQLVKGKSVKDVLKSVRNIVTDDETLKGDEKTAIRGALDRVSE